MTCMCPQSHSNRQALLKPFVVDIQSMMFTTKASVSFFVFVSGLAISTIYMANRFVRQIIYIIQST